MSSDADAVTALAALYESFYAGNYSGVSSSVLFIYDAIATLDREVACFRTASWNVAPLLFFANKGFSVLASLLPLMISYPFTSDEALTWSNTAMGSRE
ncbi:hypothetical protein C8T65DRAFT_828412 [Cerioporus squamosus]|nr:hypothetical protein C8T65DRAFT_828412 [Cerioporus squamosus]